MSVRAPGRLDTDLTKYQAAIEQLTQGRSNAVGTFTLDASATSTVVDAPNVAAGTDIFFAPQTANAAAAMATTFINPTLVAAGSFVVSHASGASTDRTFSFVGLG